MTVEEFPDEKEIVVKFLLCLCVYQVHLPDYAGDSGFLEGENQHLYGAYRVPGLKKTFVCFKSLLTRSSSVTLVAVFQVSKPVKHGR